MISANGWSLRCCLATQLPTIRLSAALVAALTVEYQVDSAEDDVVGPFEMSLLVRLLLPPPRLLLCLPKENLLSFQVEIIPCIALAFIIASWQPALVFSLMTICCMSRVSSEHENPTLIAVSCLSPVNIHTFIPASLSDAIVSGTPCCWTQHTQKIIKSSEVRVPVRSLAIEHYGCDIKVNEDRTLQEWLMYR